MAKEKLKMVKKGNKMVPFYAADGKGKMKKGGLAKLNPGLRAHMKKKMKGKKKQGYKARKDESIAMRIRKKRTKKQLKASRDESYGKFGSKAKKSGKINR